MDLPFSFCLLVALRHHVRFMGNVLKKPERTPGVSPPPLRLPPNAIQLEQVLRHHRSQRRGGMGGQALSPPSSYQCFVFHIIVKGILWSRYNGNFISFYRNNQTFFRIEIRDSEFEDFFSVFRCLMPDPSFGAHVGCIPIIKKIMARRINPN